MDHRQYSRKGGIQKEKLLENIRHELKHAEQFLDLARSNQLDEVAFNLPKRIRKIAQEKYPKMKFSKERLEDYNYKEGITASAFRVHFYILCDSKAKAMGFKNYNTMLEKSSNPERLRFWQSMEKDFLPGSRYDRVFNTLNELTKQEIQKDIDSYMNQTLEIEARSHAKS